MCHSTEGRLRRNPAAEVVLIYLVGQKTAPRTSLKQISVKSWPKTVKFCTTLAATFLNISAKNYKYVVKVKRYWPFVHDLTQ